MEFGAKLPRQIFLICRGGINWEGFYDSDNKKLLGFENFMKSHNVRQMYTVLLNYIGGENFFIEIYNSSGLAIDYSGCDSQNCMNIPNNIKEKEFILGLDDLGDEKARMRYFFSVLGRELSFYDHTIRPSDIGP